VIKVVISTMSTNKFGTGGFGATNTFGKPATGFGAPPAATGFGAPATMTGFGAAATAGFGSPASKTGFGGATGFGAPAAPTGFGAPAAPTGFGAPAPTAFGAPAAGGFGGFGAKPATTGAFGATTTTNAFGAPGAFGAPAAPAAGFGAPAAGSSFGFGQAAGAAGFGFGQQQGSVAPGGFGALAFGQAAVQQQQPVIPPEEQQIREAIERLKRSYAPAKDQQGLMLPVPEGIRNDECAFKYIALKRKDGSAQNNQALLYGNLLEQAEKDNADPDNYFVVEELGVESLKRRFTQQNDELEKSRNQVDKIKDVIKDVDLSNQFLSSRVTLLKNRQQDLNRRMLLIMKKIEVIRCHGTPLQDTERRYDNLANMHCFVLVRCMLTALFCHRYYRKLLEMAQRLERPLQVVQNMSINVALHEKPEEGAIESISDEDLASFIAALKKQSDGLEMLTDTLRLVCHFFFA
jgi:hypothetical protein